MDAKREGHRYERGTNTKCREQTRHGVVSTELHSLGTVAAQMQGGGS